MCWRRFGGLGPSGWSSATATASRTHGTARAPSRPLPHEAVLLADAGLVLEPDLDGLARREAAQMGSQRGRKVFFKRLDRARILGRVTRASTHMREAKRLEELADCTFVIGDPEPLDNDALQVDPTPAHHTVQGWSGPVATSLAISTR